MYEIAIYTTFILLPTFHVLAWPGNPQAYKLKCESLLHKHVYTYILWHANQCWIHVTVAQNLMYIAVAITSMWVQLV
jgi:hypothetical protein